MNERNLKGGYRIGDQEDLRNIHSKHLCPICSNVLKTAIQTECGHRYCLECLEEEFKKHNGEVQCIKCEAKITRAKIFRDKFADREIQALILYCVNRIIGCPWRGQLRHREEHHKSCIPVTCTNHGCNKQVTQENLPHHLQNECLYRELDRLQAHQQQHHLLDVSPPQASCSSKVEWIPKQDACMGCIEESVGNAPSTNSKQAHQEQHQYVPEVFPLQEGNIMMMNDEGCAGNLPPVSEQLLKQLRMAEEKTQQIENQVVDLKKNVSKVRVLFNAHFEEMINGAIKSSKSTKGTLVWKIDQVARKRADATSGRQVSIYSPPFYTDPHGYKMCARIYLNGDGMGKGTHISLFFVIMRGEYDPVLPWPFKQKVTMMLLDQESKQDVVDAFRPDPSSSSFQKPRGAMNIASGCPMFIPHSELDRHAYVRDDVMFIKITVDPDDC